MEKKKKMPQKKKEKKKHVACFIIYLLLALMQILRPKLLEEFVNDIEESVKASGKMKAGNLSVK